MEKQYTVIIPRKVSLKYLNVLIKSTSVLVFLGFITHCNMDETRKMFQVLIFSGFRWGRDFKPTHYPGLLTGLWAGMISQFIVSLS